MRFRVPSERIYADLAAMGDNERELIWASGMSPRLLREILSSGQASKVNIRRLLRGMRVLYLYHHGYTDTAAREKYRFQNFTEDRAR